VASIAVLLTLTVAAALVYSRMTSSRTVSSLPPSASASPHPTRTAEVLGSIQVSSNLHARCTLPVTAYSRLVRISLPDGLVTLDGAQPFDLGGPNASSYVRGRWLPVPHAWTSPDERSYASVAAVPNSAAGQAVILSDIETGKRLELWSGAGRVSVAGWGPAGVYFTVQGPSQPQGPVELLAVSPAGPGNVRRVGPNPPGAGARPGEGFPLSSNTKLSGNAAWGTAQAGDGGPYRVHRMDLRDGSVGVWYTAPANMPAYVLGFDGQDHPILALYGSDQAETKALLVLTGPNQTAEIAPPTGGPMRFATAYHDQHGIWLGSSGALWMYQAGSLFKVADIPVSLTGAATPMPIANAQQSPGNLPPVIVDGDCT
jgi:hypothetical protein